MFHFQTNLATSKCYRYARNTPTSLSIFKPKHKSCDFYTTNQIFLEPIKSFTLSLSVFDHLFALHRSQWLSDPSATLSQQQPQRDPKNNPRSLLQPKNNKIVMLLSMTKTKFPCLHQGMPLLTMSLLTTLNPCRIQKLGFRFVCVCVLVSLVCAIRALKFSLFVAFYLKRENVWKCRVWLKIWIRKIGSRFVSRWTMLGDSRCSIHPFYCPSCKWYLVFFFFV